MVRDASPRRARRFTRAVALAASVGSIGLAALVTSASAAPAVTLLPNCGARNASTPFAKWGDSHSYFMMPGGEFESGAPGWSLAGGAGVATGNERFLVRAPSDTHSLAIPSGGRATSPTICVAAGENSIRLFVNNAGVAAARLHVQASVQNPLTGLVVSTGFELNGSAMPNGWSPSLRLLIPNLLGGVAGTQNLKLEFTTSGTPARWSIDDVYVDPFKSR